MDCTIYMNTLILSQYIVMKFINITNENIYINWIPEWKPGEIMDVTHEGLIQSLENNSRLVKPLRLHKQEQKEIDNSQTYLDESDSMKVSKKIQKNK